MTTFGNWPLLERVTNDEFLKMLPHFSLEQHFLTQVFVPKKKWIHLLHANLQTMQLKCGVCNRQVRFEDIKNHLTQKEHLMCLRLNVKQFYHPFYTYGKGDVILAKSEHAPQEMREKALREVNVQMKSFKKECIIAKQFANVAQRRTRELEEAQLIETTLSKKIENPDDMIVMVSLPVEDIPKLLFCVVSGEWRPVLAYRSLTKKTTFYCNICKLNCCGTESLNSHFKGLTHRVKQLEVVELCYEDSSRVNKNCCVHFGNSFEFSVKEDSRYFLANQQENDSDSWIKKLPIKISKKIKALNVYVPKILTSSDGSLYHSGEMKDMEGDGKFEFNEYWGHLGVEYVLKILKNENDRDPRFECGLCEFVGDGKKMQRHLMFYDHKKKYLDLHYSDTIKKYESLIGHMSYKEFRSVMGEVVNKVAIEIEKHHSRSLPYTVLLSDYKARRPDLIAEAYALLHASQNRGPSFSNVLSKNDIRNLKDSAKQLAESKTYENTEYIVFTTAPKCKIYLNQMSHDPVVRLIEYKAKLNKNLTSRTSRSISPTQTQVFDRRGDSRPERSHTRIHEQRTHSRSPIYARPRTPTQRPQGLLQTSNALNHNIWDIYRREIAFSANEIEVAYENYRKNPESHPLYEEEWNNFWQHRKKELDREGYNHRSYNFQPEWVHYFKQRIEVLFGEALHKSKINIRHKLGIPLDAEEDCQRSHESAGEHAVARRIKDIVSAEIVGFQRHKRRSSSDFKACVPQKQRAFSEQMQGQRKEDLSINESQVIVPEMSDNHSNVIHVLRLMTALEEHLGSLGGKVMDLLSNALQLEKNHTGNNVEFEAKVLTIANCQLLETAMEKLKGILFAGLLDEKKISGFNRVIQHTANLLKYAEKLGWRQEGNVSEKISFRNSNNRARVIQEHGHMYVKQNRNGGGVSKISIERALSDTLMDLVNMPQTSKQQENISKEQFESYTKDHSRLPDCPPPPNIRKTSVSTQLFTGFKGQQSNSGLASFNTKLSLDQGNQLQKVQRDLSLQTELGQLHRNAISGGSNLYNNSFKNNNDTRTNINTRTINGPSMGGAMNNSSETAQFGNSQYFPNMGQNNNAMYQGAGGGNRNQSWLQWNRMK